MVSPVAPNHTRHPLRLYLLGEFRVECVNQRLPDDAWPRRSAKALVKLLAIAPGHRLLRDQLCDLLWPDLSPEAAGGALRKALHAARRALEPSLPPRAKSTYLTTQDDTVVLSSERTWIDADHFQAAAQAALAGGARDALEQAAAAYGGELLPDDRYADWAAPRRATLADLYHAVLFELASQDERLGEYVAAAELLQRVLTDEPGNEDLHRRLMRDYALGGRRHRALRQFHACQTFLQQELAAEPEAATAALYQAIRAGELEAESPSPTAASATQPVPLPAPARQVGAGPLVNRAHELSELTAALDRAADGQGGALLLGGETGVGKTRLVAELARTAHARGALVLWGACYEHDGHLPYAPLVEALDRLVAGQTADARHRLATTHPALANLLPSLHVAPAGLAGGVGANRDRLFTDVVRLLEELAGRRGLVLVLDDLHAADAASIALLHHLTQMAAERPWLIVGTFRAEDVPAGGAFQRFAATAARAGLLRRLDLDRLPRHDCRRLIAALLGDGAIPDAVVDRLYTRTLGNALFLQELVRSLHELGALTNADGAWAFARDEPAPVPHQLSDLILARIDGLGDEVRQTLNLAAAASETCSYELLRDAADVAEAPLLDALDRALAGQVLEERGEHYAFRHPLVRATLYQRLTAPRRTWLHARLARALGRMSDQAAGGRAARTEALAHHWAAAGEPARAVPYLIAAADRAARVYANTDAIARLRRALALLDELPAAERDQVAPRADILERLGDLHALVGENELARGCYLDAATVPATTRAAGDTAAARSRLHRKAAQQALFTGRLSDAERLLTEVETILVQRGDEQPGGLEQIRLAIARAQLHFLASRFEDALAEAEAALHLAEAARSTPDIADAYEMIAMACLPLGQWRRGLEYERRHAALADPNQSLRDAADVHICLSEYHLYAEAPAAATRAVLQTLEAAQRAGAPRSLALCHYYLGTMAYMRGRFVDAIDQLNEAVALYRRVESRSGEGIALMVRGLAKTALGRNDEGRADLERGVGAAEQGTLGAHGLIRLYAATGLHYLEGNDPASARRQAELGLSLADEPSTCSCYAAIHPIAAASFALTGDLAAATSLSERALAQARSIGSPYFLCKSHQATAIVLACGGSWDTAFASFDVAEGLATRHDFPYELARTLEYRAFVHQQRGTPHDLQAAAELAAQARPILQRLGVPLPAA